MTVGRHSLKIYAGGRFLQRFTNIVEEYSEPIAEIDIGQQGTILVTEIATWCHPLTDFSSYYARMQIRDNADDTLLATFREDNLRLLNKRTAGTIISDMHSNETAALDFSSAQFDLELVQHSLAASGSYGASCAVDIQYNTVSNATATTPGTMVNNANTGDVAWTNPTYVVADDSDRATADLDNQHTDQLDVTNLNFDFGMGTTIVGIKVTIKRCEENSPSGKITDYTVQLLKNGVPVGYNKADISTEWDEEASEASVDYGASDGSPEDIWGTTWTAHDISNHRFGVRIQAQETDSAATTAKINHVTVTVYFKNVGKLTAASGTPFAGWASGDLIHIASSESGNEGIYKIWGVADDEIITTAPLHGADNADDETIVISKVTLNEMGVRKFVRGSARLIKEKTYA